MHQLVDIDDIFTAGLGFEMAGAYLLARGVLSGPREMARRAVSYYDFSAPLALAEARDRVDGNAGIFGLVGGFALQVAGYVAALAGGENGHGSGRAAVAAAIAALAAAVALGIWRLAREAAVRRTLVTISSFDERGNTRRPSAARLRVFGAELGEEPRPDERTPAGATEYARRVFGVVDVEPATEHWQP